MAIREDLVASAAKFLQDPSVASSPVEKRIAFLQAKNLTPEEINAALTRAPETGTPVQAQSYPPSAASSYPATQPPPYYGQQFPGQPPAYPWQPPPPPPSRDWRDWFIMATVVSGVGYGLYSLGKRYVYPLVAPPTPDRLEQDKKAIDEQFDKTFALVEQLAKDTEALKAAEQERTDRLDSALTDLETVINDLKSASRRRDDEAQRMRDDVQNLKDSIPRALSNQKDLTDNRLREVNAELKSLKTLLSQRMNPPATTSTSTTGVGSYLRQNGSGTATPNGAAAADENTNAPTATTTGQESQAKQPSYRDFLSGTGRSSPFGSGAQVKIPEWQRMASNNAATSSASSSTAPAAESGSSASTNGAPAPAATVEDAATESS